MNLSSSVNKDIQGQGYAPTFKIRQLKKQMNLVKTCENTWIDMKPYETRPRIPWHFGDPPKNLQEINCFLLKCVTHSCQSWFVELPYIRLILSKGKTQATLALMLKVVKHSSCLLSSHIFLLQPLCSTPQPPVPLLSTHLDLRLVTFDSPTHRMEWF